MLSVVARPTVRSQVASTQGRRCTLSISSDKCCLAAVLPSSRPISLRPHRERVPVPSQTVPRLYRGARAAVLRPAAAAGRRLLLPRPRVCRQGVCTLSSLGCVSTVLVALSRLFLGGTSAVARLQLGYLSAHPLSQGDGGARERHAAAERRRRQLQGEAAAVPRRAGVAAQLQMSSRTH